MQLTLFSNKKLKTFESLKHGGGLRKNKRKIKRPLIPNKITHVVFKSSKAKNHLSFYKHKNSILKLLHERSKKYNIEILDFVNMGNHLHIKARSKNLSNLKNFLRTFPALLARKITRARKGFKFGKFWDHLVFTRVLLSSFEILGLKGYFQANRIQRKNGYEARLDYLNGFNHYILGLKKNTT